MTRLVALDAREHAPEEVISDVIRERREPDELEVREAGLEDEVRRDRAIERAERAAPAERFAHREDEALLLVLRFGVLREGRLVRLLPAGPRCGVEPRRARDRLRKHLARRDVRGLPVELSGKRQPVVAL